MKIILIPLLYINCSLLFFFYKLIIVLIVYRLFQEDVKQVLDWLTNHGEVFIRKNTGVGRNLQKARVYQKSHEHFENVAQVITQYI